MAWQATAVRRRLHVRDDEARLVRGAAAGESWAVAALYRRYEERLFNLALRITGDEDDAADAAREAFLGVLGRLPGTPDPERRFAGQALAAARDAGHDAIGRRRAAGPAKPRRGGGWRELEATADDDESRLLEDWQQGIHAANARLPAPQRDVLALREPGGLSHGEIAQIMQLDHDSVAELIATARIRLHDELRGTELAAEPLASETCGQALGLMARRDDRELPEGSADADWLIEHLAACQDCRAYLDAMQEARLAYSDWEPVAAPPRLLAATLAEAAALVGPHDGPGRAEAAAAEPAGEDPTRPFVSAPSADERRRRRRRDVLLAGAWGAVVLVGVLAVLVGGVFDSAEGEDRPPEPSLDSPATTEPAAAPAKPARRKRATKRAEEEPALPGRPQPVVAQPAQRPAVVVVTPRARQPRRAAPRPRARRPRTGRPRATPPEPGPAPRQQAPAPAPAPPATPPTTPTTPAPQQPPNARCPNPGGEPVPC